MDFEEISGGACGAPCGSTVNRQIAMRHRTGPESPYRSPCTNTKTACCGTTVPGEAGALVLTSLGAKGAC